MPSFDVVSETDMAEVDNAVQNVMREVGTRFDFKGSRSTLERNGETLVLLADDDLKLKQMHELLKTHLVRRKVDPKALDYGKAEAASGNMVRQEIRVKQGVDAELAKKIVKQIKGSKMKVQAAIQGDQLRITGKKRDDLQAAINLIKEMKPDQPLQYTNFRD
jgi:uncharacterized protein YajQ (UPF0234 family)